MCVCVSVYPAEWNHPLSRAHSMNLALTPPFFTTAGLLSLSLPLSVSSFLFIALQILYPSHCLFFYHLPPSLFLSRQKHRWKPPDKIEIMAYVQSARGANQRPSWEKHRGDGGGGGGGVGGRRKTRPIVPRRLKSPKRRHCPRTGINLPPPVTQGLNSILLNPS